MAKRRTRAASASSEGVISIIGAGTRLVGDCETHGTVRIEGHVEGSVRAEKAVVVGEGGVVHGDILTGEATISGSVYGTVMVEELLTMHATCWIEGGVRANRIQLEDGAVLHGAISIGSGAIHGGVASFADPPTGRLEGDAASATRALAPTVTRA